MGQGEEVKTRTDPQVEILEKGEIFFFYRPKVSKDVAEGPNDVQRMYIVLRAESSDPSPVEAKQAHDSGKDGGEGEGGRGYEEVNVEKQPLFRLIVMGRKSLPEPSNKGHRHRPFWGFVELVSTDLNDVKTALKGEEYDTATRGHRRQSPARAAGEGIYRILRHHSGRRTHTHLVYKLEFPSRSPSSSEHAPQESLNVAPEASFLVQIKNPDQPAAGEGDNAGGTGAGGFRGLRRKRRAAFPARLQGRFGSNRYAPADPPDLMNYEGCELLLIAAADDVEAELGLELRTECEGKKSPAAEEEAEEGDGGNCRSDLMEMFGDAVVVKPLLTGQWE